MSPTDTMLKIAKRLESIGSEADADRLRAIVRDITAWQIRYREVESLGQRLCQCEGELRRIREVTLGLDRRTSKNQEPKSPRVR